MPPFQIRSTGASSTARFSSAGVSDPIDASRPSASAISDVIGIDFALSGNTPPPGEMSERS